MKKSLFALVFSAVAAMPAFATDYSGVLGASLGQVTDQAPMLTGFYGTAGTTVSIAVVPWNSASGTAAYCGISALSDYSNIYSAVETDLVQSFDWTLQTSDLYIITCVKKGGTPDGALLAMATRSTPRAADRDAPSDADAVARLQPTVDALAAQGNIPH